MKPSNNQRNPRATMSEVHSLSPNHKTKGYFATFFKLVARHLRMSEEKSPGLLGKKQVVRVSEFAQRTPFFPRDFRSVKRYYM